MPSSWWTQATAFEAVRLGSTPSEGAMKYTGRELVW